MLKKLKELMRGENAVVLVLSGTERLEEISKYSREFGRRFSKIRPRQLEAGSDNSAVEDVVQHYANMAELEVRLCSDFSGRLMHGSRYLFGMMFEIIIEAIERALRDGDDTLQTMHFAEIWARREGCSPDQNVFLMSRWSALDIDEKAREYEDARTERQRKALGRT